MSAGFTPGPWAWFGTASRENLWLGTAHSGRIYVMGFKRWGTQGAQPIFQVKGMGMVPAKELLQFEVGDKDVVGMTQAKQNGSVYRCHVRGIAHPDARLICHAPELYDELSRIHVGTTIATEHFNRIQRLLARIQGEES